MDGLEVGLLETLLKKRSAEMGVSRILDVECKTALGPGENYASEILRLNATVVLGSGRITKRSIIVKKIRGDATHSIDDFFRAEIMMYSEILPLMEELMENHCDTRDILWADYYGTTGKMLLFEDLQKTGFKLGDRRAGHDLNHALLALKNMARFHAMSSVLLRQGTIKGSQFPIAFFARNEQIVNLLYNGGFQTLAGTMESTWGPEWQETVAQLKVIGNSIGQKLQELYHIEEDKFHVVNHGDCWINNMLFKYEPDSNYPIGIRFVDYQLPHYNSYGWDLMYFYYSSIKPEVRRVHGKELVSAYHTALISTLEFYGSVPDNAPTRDDIEAEMERLLLVGLMVSCTLLPITMADPADAIKTEKKSDLSDVVIHNSNMYTNKRYTEVIMQDLQYFISKGLL